MCFALRPSIVVLLTLKSDVGMLGCASGSASASAVGTESLRLVNVLLTSTDTSSSKYISETTLLIPTGTTLNDAPGASPSLPSVATRTSYVFGSLTLIKYCLVHAPMFLIIIKHSFFTLFFFMFASYIDCKVFSNNIWNELSFATKVLNTFI
jgi:hypothetical protein